MIQIAWIPRNLHRTHLRAHRGHHFAQRWFADLQCNPGPHSAVVPRRVPAAMQIQADRGSALQKLLTDSVMPGDEQWHRTLDARAYANFRPDKAKGGVCAGNGAHSWSPRKRREKIKQRHFAPDRINRSRPSMG